MKALEKQFVAKLEMKHNPSIYLSADQNDPPSFAHSRKPNSNHKFKTTFHSFFSHIHYYQESRSRIIYHNKKEKELHGVKYGINGA